MTYRIFGVLKEVKEQEGRVGMTPDGVRALVALGEKVLVENGAGVLSGYSDTDYLIAGAEELAGAEDIWSRATFIVKVKEPQPSEYPMLELFQKGTLFTYLHLAGVDPELTTLLLRNEITAIAYETVSQMGPSGRMIFPLLVPMSKIAGEQAMIGAIRKRAEKKKGKLSAVIIGGGNVGEAALRSALDYHVAPIVLFEEWDVRASELRNKYGGEQLIVLPMSALESEAGLAHLKRADVVISAPMRPGGASAPIVLSTKLLGMLKKGACVVDVSIDQGGSSDATVGNATKPGETFVWGKKQIIVSATANIPGSTVPKDATRALTEATLPYVLEIARHRAESLHMGPYCAMRDNKALRLGLQTYRGFLRNKAVSDRYRLFRDYRPLDELFDW